MDLESGNLQKGIAMKDNGKIIGKMGKVYTNIVWAPIKALSTTFSNMATEKKFSLMAISISGIMNMESLMEKGDINGMKVAFMKVPL